VASIGITRRRRLVKLVLAVHALLFCYGVALIFSWRNHDGVRFRREDRFYQAGHPVLSAADHRYRQRRSYGVRR